MAQPTLTGPRVRLRPWRPDDADAVFSACQDHDIQRWTQVPVPYRPEHAVGFVTGRAPATWSDGGALFAVESAEGGPLMGSMGLFPPRDGVAEAGYWTVAEHRGRGYTGEALRVLAGWALDDRGVHRVELLVGPRQLRFPPAGPTMAARTTVMLRPRWVVDRRVDMIGTS